MTGQELITHLRESILDDAAPPYLWSDTELLRYLNYAEVQACRRAHLIIDDITANDSGTAATASASGQKPLCLLYLEGDQATYNLSPKVLQIKRCQLKSMTYPIDGPKSYPEMDELMSGWRGTSGTVGTSGSSGYPIFFLNEPGNTITFVQAPSPQSELVTSPMGTSGWTFGTAGTDGSGGWSITNGTSGTMVKTASTSGTLYASASAGMTAPVPGLTYKTKIVCTAVAGSPTYTMAGVAGTTISASTVSDYITALTTAKISIAGTAGVTATITSISIKIADIAYLVVSRLPLLPFTMTTSPEIEEKYHEGLMDWAAHLAYMKNDSDTLNLNMAKVYEDKFKQSFGVLADAYSERMRKVLSQKQRMRPRIFGS
jgi:hypothetical protein